MLAVFSFVVICLCFSGQAKGQIFLPGRCPNVTSQEDFNVEKYTGTWYELQRSFALFELGLKCVTAEYTSREAKKIDILNKGIEFTGMERVVAGEGLITDDQQPAILKVKLEGGVPFAVNYTVISTDYDSYALVFSCLNVATVHSENMWILGRQAKLDDNKIDELKDIFRANGINPKHLAPVDQDCSDSKA